LFPLRSAPGRTRHWSGCPFGAPLSAAFDKEMKRLRVIFRFLALTPKQAKDLKAAFPSCELGRHFKTGRLVGCIALNSRSKIDPVVSFKTAHEVKAKDCDVFVSLLTDNDTGIINVPDVVNRLIREIDCRIVFSFTSV
jgi:hypothetical protein